MISYRNEAEESIMRDVKFRAWNGIDCAYVEWHTLKGMPILLSKMMQAREKHYSIEQFTGLQDKNGVDIYEGDVISSGENQSSHCFSGVHEVKFSEGGFSPFSITGWDGTMDADDCDIIGNIHQNPELLINT